MSSVLTHANVSYVDATDLEDSRSIGIWSFKNSVSSPPIHLDVSGPYDGSGFDADIRLTVEQAEQLVRALTDAIDALQPEEVEEPEDYDAYVEARFGRPSRSKLGTSYGRLRAESGWDPVYPQDSRVFNADGTCIGVLKSVDPDVIANSPGIQSWSKPGA